MDDIADVCARFAADADMFNSCISCLTSLMGTGRALATLMETPATSALVIQVRQRRRVMPQRRRV